MVEVTHTSEAIYGLRKAVGRGSRLWAGKVAVSDGETIDTGLDTIEGISGAMTVDADIDANTGVIGYSAVSGGTITFQAGAKDAYGALTSEPFYLIVVGVVR